MKNLLIANRTLSTVNNYLINPGAPILLTGRPGAGKETLVFFMLDRIVPKKTSRTQIFTVKKNQKKQDITIDQIRSLRGFLKLRSTGTETLRRAVVILDADKMNDEAQNALLKILEEPPQDTVFILTAKSEKNLLPTIPSRCKKISVLPVTIGEAKDFFRQFPEDTVETSMRLSGGLPGLTTSLLNNGDNELVEAVSRVKKFLVLSKYEKLIFLEEHLSTREQFSQFIDALYLSLKALEHAAIRNKDHNRAKKLLNSRKLIFEIQDYLFSNTSLKISFDELVLNLEL